MAATALTAAALVVRFGPSLARIGFTAAQRLASSHAETPNNKVDYVVGSNPAVQNNVRQSSNNQGFLNAINHHNTVSAAVQATKTLSHVSDTPTLKPKGGPQAGG